MIRIENLSKSFRRQKVLDGLSLSIGAGDRIALIGANGAGKTTLIRCLLGEYVYDGEIRVDGLSPRADRRAVLKDIGFVPQLPPPLKMSVGELILFAATVSDTPRTAIEAVLERLGLDHDAVRSKPFVRLSGGQKQKILAAIALGRDCRLLILDEPTANLDPAARKVLFDLLAERPDRPLLISSHRLEEVAGLVNRVIEIDRGKVVLDERIASASAVSARQPCEIVTVRQEPAFAKAMADWGFAEGGNGLSWHGEVASPDRMRFLAMITRFGGLVTALKLGEPASADPPNNKTHVGWEGRHADCDAQ